MATPEGFLLLDGSAPDSTNWSDSMSDLTWSDRRKLEVLLGLSSGRVLNFSNRTFGEFFDEYRVEIEARRYRTGSASKANRMRAFWKKESNLIVGRVIDGLIAYGSDERCLPDDAALIDDCCSIAQRLLTRSTHS